MQVLHEQLPDSVHAPATKKQYLDSICKHFRLKHARVGGNGNCFFVACAKVLSCLGITVDASALRQQVVAFLRECYFDRLHGVLGERCCIEMEHEVHARIPLVSSTARHNGFVPDTMESYLTATADIRVWACGYHWIRAVASLHAVSIVIVIHSFDYVQLFCEDSTHPRVFLYKTDVETHYDALVPEAAPVSNADDLSQNSEAYVSSQPPGLSPSEESNVQPASIVPLTLEQLRAARLKALSLQPSAASLLTEVTAAVAATCLLSLHSSEEVVVLSSETEGSLSSNDDGIDGWTKNGAYEAYVLAVLDAGHGSWDRRQVINEIGNRASFNFPSWRRLSELDRFAKINSVISSLRKMVRSAHSALSSGSNAGDHCVGVVVYTSVFECSS